MRGVLVEIRRGERVVARLALDTYLSADPADVPDGEALLVFECPRCSCFHDLGNMAEVVAAFGAGASAAARRFSDACVAGAARGGQ